MSAPAHGALLIPVENKSTREETRMYKLNDIELSKQHREDVARQVEYNRLSRQLRAYSRMAAGTASALPGRTFAWSPRNGQTVEC
jgi:predicted ester cyclase